MTTTTNSEILIRRAYADDAVALRRLADLDSAPERPAAPLLVAEVDGELAVALSLHDGSVIADPFRPTAAIVDLLVSWAARLEGPRSASSGRRGPAWRAVLSPVVRAS